MVTRCVSISVFASLAGIPREITSSAVETKVSAIIARIKKYNTRNKKKKIKHDKIILLAKTKLNAIEVLTSRALIDPYIGHDKILC